HGLGEQEHPVKVGGGGGPLGGWPRPVHTPRARGTEVPAPAAVILVGRGVDACAVTVRLARGTVARPVGARAAGTCVATRPAVVRVRRDVHARVVAERLSDRTGADAFVAPLRVRAHIATRAAVLAVVREEDAFAIAMHHPIRALTGSLHAVLPDATLYVATAAVEPVVLRIDACAVAARIAEQGVAAGRAAGDLAREGRAALV